VAHLDIGNLQTRPSFDRQPAHGKALLGRRDGAWPVRRLRAWHDENLVQLSAVNRGFSGCQVPEVDRVEGPAQNADPQG
jgi:hypothetical protein